MKEVTDILKKADIRVGGNRPWDIQIHNPKFYNRVLRDGSLGLGESYMEGWWDCKAIDELINKLLRAEAKQKVSLRLATKYISAKLFNLQSKSKSLEVAKVHYDLGNEFYADMLDPLMQYTCAYWKNAKNLKEAQENKLDLICRKLGLKKGDTVLELGCGWGGFAYYAAKKYGCHVTGYNISKEQVAYAREKTKGLPVKIVQADYRDAKGTYDYIVSIGMCEHVGPKNYKGFFELARKCLKKDGLFLLHTIGSPDTVAVPERWFSKYIFPGGHLPSIAQLSKAAENRFVLEDFHNIGPHYDKTLMAWHENYKKNWHKHKDKYPEMFERMWDYYLLCCAGTFRSRHIQLWQFVWSPQGITGGYETVR